MSYSDFDLRKVKQLLGLQLIEKQNIFLDITNHEISSTLADTLAENVPLARALNTEKARSELIIINILMELRKIFNHQMSLFSGIEFNVDKEKGLNGFCDFMISASPEQLLINNPIIAVVEAKNENIIGGLGQCIAEMYAARIFNERNAPASAINLNKIYGTVTTGTAWKFLKMDGNNVYIDLDEYPIENPQKILGILAAMIAFHA